MKQLLPMFGAAVLLWAGNPPLEEARKFYQLSAFEKSLQVLLDIPDKDADAWELVGLNYYGQADYKKATDALEKALSLNPNSSQINLWIGRAYGRRAETSNPFMAPVYASKARQFFERATQLDPRNLEAQSDLFEYYLEAPGFLGGGYDKAAAVADRMSAIDQVEGYWAQSKLAEKHKEYSNAEALLRQAIRAAPQQVGRLIDLARFLNKQGRHEEADQSFAQAEQISPNNPRIIFARAECYVKSKRRLDVAQTLLRRYLSLTVTPDDPPKAEAQRLLKQAQGS